MRCTMVGLRPSRRAISRTPISAPSASTISRMSRPRSSDCDPDVFLVERRTLIGPGLLDLDDFRDADLAVLHRLQHDEAARRVVVVEPDLLAHDVGELQVLDRVLDP